MAKYQFSNLTMVILLFIGLGFNTLSSQQMNIKSRWEIVHDDQIVDYRNLGEKFSFDQEIYKNYDQSLRSYKFASTAGWSSLTALGLGGILVVMDRPTSTSTTRPTFQAIGFGMMAIVFPVLGTSSLVALLKGKSKQRKVIDAYNQKVLGYKKEKVRLDIGLTQNGLGLVYRF